MSSLLDAMLYLLDAVILPRHIR